MKQCVDSAPSVATQVIGPAVVFNQKQKCDHIRNCMQTLGYTKRATTVGEAAEDLALSPVYLLGEMYAGTCFEYSRPKRGNGKSEFGVFQSTVVDKDLPAERRTH
jgi:hypothetical protein